MNSSLYIRSVGVVSPLGIGFDAFASALQGDRSPLEPQAPAAAVCGTTPWPDQPGHWRVDFDARVCLGDKGVATLDRSTQMSILACKEALHRSGLADDPAERARTGVVLGTSAGSLRSIADFVRSTYTPRPHMVSPMQFPNTVMNCAAGQCAIWHGLRGVNSTVCAGDLSGLAALQYAGRMLRLGHTSRLLVGSVEEYCDFMAWSHQAMHEGSSAPFGEGVAMFTLEHTVAANDALAELVGVRLRTASRAAGNAAALAEALAKEVDTLLAQSRATACELRWWAGHAADCEEAHSPERLAVSAILGDVSPNLTVVPPRVAQRSGRTYSASVSLQLAGALALAPQGLGLLTAMSEQGQVGCALIRTYAGPQAHQRAA
jgi:3-oxoacyl-[acyl-carrier-protein] synthase II